MDSKIEEHKQECNWLCNKLIGELNKNKEDAGLIFGGEILKAYMNANEKALDKARRVRNKINNI